MKFNYNQVEEVALRLQEEKVAPYKWFVKMNHELMILNTMILQWSTVQVACRLQEEKHKYKNKNKYKYKMHNNGLQYSRRGGVPITRGESGLRATAAVSSRLL